MTRLGIPMWMYFRFRSKPFFIDSWPQVQKTATVDRDHDRIRVAANPAMTFSVYFSVLSGRFAVRHELSRGQAVIQQPKPRIAGQRAAKRW